MGNTLTHKIHTYISVCVCLYFYLSISLYPYLCISVSSIYVLVGCDGVDAVELHYAVGHELDGRQGLQRTDGRMHGADGNGEGEGEGDGQGDGEGEGERYM